MGEEWNGTHPHKVWILIAAPLVPPPLIYLFSSALPLSIWTQGKHPS